MLNVNVETSKQLGDKILKTMAGKSAQEISFKSKEQSVTMNDSSHVQINDEAVNISETTVRETFEDTKELFTNELCNYLAALFDTSVPPNEPHQHKLANAIWQNVVANHAAP